MKKIIIRPFNIVNAIFLLIVILFSAIVSYSLIEIIFQHQNLAAFIILVLLYILVFGWLNTTLLCIVLRPKIILFDDHMEIVHWKNGTPYNKAHPISLPKTQKTLILYNDLSLFGGFLIKDISEYIKKNSGFLSDKWMVATSTPIPIPIKLPKITTKLKDVLLFVRADGESFVVDGGQYGYKQVENLLFELEKRTKIQSTGRVAPRKRLNSFLLNMVKSYLTLACFTVLPISTVWIEGILNPAHIPSYQSLWRTIYIISAFLAGLSLAGYIASRKIKNDPEAARVGKVFMIASFILYPVFLTTFVIAVVT